MKQPYNVSVVAELAACAALSNPDYLEVSLKFFQCTFTNFTLNQEVKNAIVMEREKMFKMMSSFSFLEPYKSQSNFILCR